MEDPLNHIQATFFHEEDQYCYLMCQFRSNTSTYNTFCEILNNSTAAFFVFNFNKQFTALSLINS